MSKDKKIYTLTDCQSGEKQEYMEGDDLIIFANELYWNDPEVEFTDVEKAITAIEGSDYEVNEIKPVKAKNNSFEMER